MINISYLFNFTALFFFLAFTNVMCADEIQCPNNYTVRTTLSKLKKYTFCKYDSFIRPVRKHEDAVDVKIRLVVRKIEFDEKNDALKIYSFFPMIWNDYHLVWNATDFDNIDQIQVLSYFIWRPDIALYSFADPTYPMYYYYTICEVRSDGQVRCVPPVTHTSSCAANLLRWPYDQHTCKMILGSWTHSGEEMNLILLGGPVLIYDYNVNREWLLISSDAYKEVDTYDCCPNETYPTVTYKFVIQRQSGIYTATVIVPTVVLMLMTLVTFWMLPGKSDRLFIAALDLFSHFLFLQHLGYILPSNGRDTPLLVTFYRDSLLLTTMALIMAIFGKLLETSKQPIPLWASGMSGWILENRLMQIILFNPAVVKQVNSEESGTENEAFTDFPAISPTSSWNTIIGLLDMMFFIIALFVYAILIFGFVP